jgi:DNA polymerase-3 subunit gamma/tau
MLSKGAFNALLKTLEEPPAHVVFILATTEPHKIPDTIISRCQALSFKKPNDEALVKMILSLSKKEEIEIDKDAVSLIAMLGDGSFRDAQVVLQQVATSSADKKITLEEVESITGVPAASLSHDLILAILDEKKEVALPILNKVLQSNLDARFFVKMIIKDLRKILLLKLAPAMKAEIVGASSTSENGFLEKTSSHKNVKIMSQILREFLDVYNEVPKSYISTLPVELAVVRLLGQDNKVEK